MPFDGSGRGVRRRSTRIHPGHSDVARVASMGLRQHSPQINTLLDGTTRQRDSLLAAGQHIVLARDIDVGAPSVYRRST